MNVLLIHQAFASHGDAGGTRHFELARYCSERGCRFTIVTSASSYLTGRRKKQNEIATSGLIIHRALALPDLSNNFFWRLLSFSSFACSSLAAGLLERKMDVVLGTSPPIFQAVAAWLTAVCRRRPFVLEVRDLWPEFAIDMGILRNKLLIYLSRRLEIFLYRRARHIIVNSPAYREHIMQKGIAREKISLIANGVDTAMFAVKTDERRCLRMWGLEEKYVVIYAGAMGRANDLGTLLQSASLLKEQHAIHFLLLGDGKERNRLQTMARELSLNNVTFAGAVAREEMPRIDQGSLEWLLSAGQSQNPGRSRRLGTAGAGRYTIIGTGCEKAGVCGFGKMMAAQGQKPRQFHNGTKTCRTEKSRRFFSSAPTFAMTCSNFI